LDYLLVCTVSLVVAALTLFSGFGLGTLLMPAFAVFFPLEVAIAATAVVHLANNVFKIALVGRWAKGRVVLWFGIPAIIATVLGAQVMLSLAHVRPIASYSVGPVRGTLEPIKLVIAAILALFAALELSPAFHKLSFPARMLPVGGALSGFFGGLTGMQGALRAAFLVRAGLTRDQFVGTAAVVSTLVDLARLAVYTLGFSTLGRSADWDLLRNRDTQMLIAAACIAAFVGSYFGAKLVKKVTLKTIQRIVAVMLIIFAAALGAGLV
jgi:uncharacterized membrane protein YfcA